MFGTSILACHCPIHSSHSKASGTELLEPAPYHSPFLSVCMCSSENTDLLNVFEVFLPQLLLYPNANDPLNGAAAALYLRDPQSFNHHVKAHVARHASPEAIQQQEESAMDVDDDLSSLGSISDGELDDLIFE